MLAFRQRHDHRGKATEPEKHRPWPKPQSASAYKKPFSDCIVTPGKYRDNHVPYRELSGTIQQVEKYRYHLNRWGREGEIALTKRYSAKLPADLTIRIASPSGLAILGRDNNLTTTQRHDFELIRRQYKHVADIITYDDLLRRLRHALEQLRAGN